MCKNQSCLEKETNTSEILKIELIFTHQEREREDLSSQIFKIIQNFPNHTLAPSYRSLSLCFLSTFEVFQLHLFTFASTTSLKTFSKHQSHRLLHAQTTTVS